MRAATYAIIVEELLDVALPPSVAEMLVGGLTKDEYAGATRAAAGICIDLMSKRTDLEGPPEERHPRFKAWQDILAQEAG